MPNWCDCELKVIGEEKEIEKFIERARSEHRELDFEKFIPYPEYYNRMDNKSPDLGFSSGGYEWCVENWGTKWNAHKSILKKDELGKKDILYSFYTAWGPPIPVVKKMASEFPALQFDLRYFERGAGFQGILIVCGEEIKSELREGYIGNRGG